MGRENFIYIFAQQGCSGKENLFQIELGFVFAYRIAQFSGGCCLNFFVYPSSSCASASMKHSINKKLSLVLAILLVFDFYNRMYKSSIWLLLPCNYQSFQLLTLQLSLLYLLYLLIVFPSNLSHTPPFCAGIKKQLTWILMLVSLSLHLLVLFLLLSLIK